MRPPVLKLSLFLLLTFLCTTAAIHAASFVVPDDYQLIHSTRTIIVASALGSYTRLTDGRQVETITTFSVEEVLKGSLRQRQIDIVEPGGVFEQTSMYVSGVPRFADGERYLLFLLASPDTRWHVGNLVLGKFSFATDVDGHSLLVRDEDEINGWNPDGSPHVEPHRLSVEFLQFIRGVGRGELRPSKYFVRAVDIVLGSSPVRPLASVSPMSARLVPAVNATYSASSYTSDLGGGFGARWTVFPSAVTFYSVGSEPGAPGGGTTAINTAFAAWNGDPNSNINYVYGGADASGSHNGGVGTADGQNTIAFEQNLSSHGVGPFQCSANSFSGTLGLGSVTTAKGTHTGPGGETFFSTAEGDVQMNQGIANCALILNNGDFNTAVAHEVGHTLGFRHSDKNRTDTGACGGTLECSSVAVMKSFIPSGVNGALQEWDHHAAAAVYPGSGSNPPPVAVTFTDDPLVPGVTVVKAIHLAELRSAVNALRASAGLPAASFTDAATPGVVIKAVHINELRVALDAARSALGLSTGGYTDTLAPGTVIKAIHFQELRNRLK